MTVLQRTTSRLSQHGCSRRAAHTPNTTRLLAPHATASAQSPSIILSPQQVRWATYIPRPKRPYTFTQLVRLSDGSTFMHRTTSPQPLYTSRKDARNTLLWNPSSEKLMNVESDTAGRLAAFRERFGRGWDAKEGDSADVATEGQALEEGYRRDQEEDKVEMGGLMDLLNEAAGGRKGKNKKAKGKQ